MKTRGCIHLIKVGTVALLLTLTAVAVRGAASSSNFDLDEESSPHGAGDTYSTTFALAGMIPESPTGPQGLSVNYVLNTDFVPDSYEPIDLTPPVIVAGPVVLYIADDRAVIEWTTDEPADGLVEYGLTLGYGFSQAHSGFATLHQVLITGLSASTLYNFRVNSTDPYFNGPTQSANDTFTTTATPDITPPGISFTPMALAVDTLQVDFSAAEPADSIFEWGTTAALGTLLADPVFQLDHTRTISGVLPGSVVFYEITLTDPSGNAASTGLQSFTLPAAVTVTTTMLPAGRRGKGYNQALAATGGIQPLTWAIVAGTLPPGLVLDAGTGLITGTPTASGTSGFAAQATDSGTNPSSDTMTLSITVKKSAGKEDDDGGCIASSRNNSWLVAALALFVLVLMRRRSSVFGLTDTGAK
jgi:hypothetical protein